LSGHLHGNPETAQRDREIRDWLRAHGYEVIEIAVSDLDDEGAMVGHFRKLAGYLHARDLRDSVRDDTSWFRRATESGAESDTSPFSLRIVQPSEDEQYVTCVPLVPLQAAAGSFGDSRYFEEGDWDWVEVETGHRLHPGIFVARVEGRSMEPRIPDGSYCLFDASESGTVGGTRQGKIVLVQLRDEVDPETGERYTVKQYESKKVESEEDVWRHISIALKPLNPEYESIELICEDEGSDDGPFRVIAELIEVLG